MRSLIFQIEWLRGRRNSILMGEDDVVKSDGELVATMECFAGFQKSACSTISEVIQALEVGIFLSPVVVERRGVGMAVREMI